MEAVVWHSEPHSISFSPGELAGQCWRARPGGEDERKLVGWSTQLSPRPRTRVSWLTSNWPIYDLLEHEKGPNLQIQRWRSPQHRATAGYPRGVTVRIQYWQCSKSQRPWTRPMAHCNEHLQLIMYELKGFLYLIYLFWPLSSSDTQITVKK